MKIANAQIMGTLKWAAPQCTVWRSQRWAVRPNVRCIAVTVISIIIVTMRSISGRIQYVRIRWLPPSVCERQRAFSRSERCSAKMMFSLTRLRRNFLFCRSDGAGNGSTGNMRRIAGNGRKTAVCHRHRCGWFSPRFHSNFWILSRFLCANQPF